MKEMIGKLEILGISLNEVQLAQFEQYYEMLVEKNKVMNLTTITEREEVADKHFIDSLSLCQIKNLQEELKILDLGTGAGFPGIPLKIAFPELQIVLLDSLNKRIKFLNEVIEQLHLTGIKAIHGRAEDYAKESEYREQFDLCVSRAVANLSTLSEYCMPYVKVGGQFISYKSGAVMEEVSQSDKALKTLGGKLHQVVPFKLPMTEIERSFVVIDKKKQTPKMYPRKAGLPSKEPLS